jgi:carbamoyl-phosphate synthase large subunit
MRAGIGCDEINAITGIDLWFLHNIKEIVDLEVKIAVSGSSLSDELFIQAKRYGFSDRQLASLTGKKEEEIAARRKALKVMPDFKLVDTCAAEFQAFTPYYYSTYE